MYKLSIPDFDISMIADSGQCFRLKKLEEGIYSLKAGGSCLGILQKSGSDHVIFSCGQREFCENWRLYFDLDTDYGEIKRRVDRKDSFLSAAVSYGGGIRILRQDLWETIVSFLISQNNNISRITNSIEALCQKYGERRTADMGVDYYTFPSPESIAVGGLEGLKDLGLGYRDNYVLAMAKRCCGPDGKQWLEELKRADYTAASELLGGELGIGRKVADCICLFGLHHVDAFPVDTHIRQILETYYPDGFPFARYQGIAGILQQYIFYYKRNKLGQKKQV